MARCFMRLKKDSSLNNELKAAFKEIEAKTQGLYKRLFSLCQDSATLDLGSTAFTPTVGMMMDLQAPKSELGCVQFFPNDSWVVWHSNLPMKSTDINIRCKFLNESNLNKIREYWHPSGKSSATGGGPRLLGAPYET